MHAGRLLVALVREFLEWSGMEFTIKVFAPEMGPEADYKGRMELCRQLGVASDVVSDSPLLLSVLKQFQSGVESGISPVHLTNSPAVVALHYGEPMYTDITAVNVI